MSRMSWRRSQKLLKASLDHYLAERAKDRLVAETEEQMTGEELLVGEVNDTKFYLKSQIREAAKTFVGRTHSRDLMREMTEKLAPVLRVPVEYLLGEGP